MMQKIALAANSWQPAVKLQKRKSHLFVELPCINVFSCLVAFAPSTAKSPEQIIFSCYFPAMFLLISACHLAKFSNMPARIQVQCSRQAIIK